MITKAFAIHCAVAYRNFQSRSTIAADLPFAERH